MPRQTLVPGRLEQAYRRELDRLITGDALGRLWSRDTSLWPSAERNRQDLAPNFAWLDLPEYIGPHMERVGQMAAGVRRQGFQDVVFVAIGDSNLAMAAIARASAEIRWRRVFLLDSTDPEAIRAIDAQLDFSSTLFVFASKSGKRIETHALLLYFLHRLKTLGVTEAGRCFVAVTEAGSYLEEHARTYHFLATFLDPPGIKGRYSSLIHFGLLLSALWRFEPADLTSRAVAMRDLCKQASPPDANPALTLAALLAAGAQSGHDKLVLFSSPSMEASTHRIAQLVGTSTSKGGHGLIPVCEAGPRTLEPYTSGAIATVLTMAGDDITQVQESAAHLQAQGVPVISAELESPAELGAELFKWEIATALACSLLQVNPFDEPDTQARRERASEIVEDLAACGEMPARRIRIQEREIELYAEGATRQQISTLSLADALRTFFELKRPDGYLALISFVGGGNPAAQASLERIRQELTLGLGMPVLLSAGPGYLHYFEQVYKGGPSKGLFLILTGDPVADLDIPGAGYTFGKLQLALAIADVDALDSREKPVLRLHLRQATGPAFAALEHIVQQALAGTRGLTR